MDSSQTKLPVVYLKPGEIYVGHKPSLVTTILGSCVSIVFFNRRFELGAICHALLPAGDCKNETYRYVDCCINRMLESFNAYGLGPSEIEVKLFGGSDILQVTRESGDRKTIGRQNIEAALEAIDAMGLQLTASDVGGSTGRKIFFYTHTGEVFLKRQRKMADLDPVS